jgi:hypothetical protein
VRVGVAIHVAIGVALDAAAMSAREARLQMKNRRV